MIALTVCPLNGNCIYNHRIDTGVNFCGRSACAYPDLQRKALIKAAAQIRKYPERGEEADRRLKKYLAYLQALNHRGGDP
nr:MAG TPA: hypothetical protein [Caudoviricetes sp.]